MKTLMIAKSLHLGGVLGMGLCLATWTYSADQETVILSDEVAVAAAATTSQNMNDREEKPIELPKSVFVVDNQNARDPFYPTSLRRFENEEQQQQEELQDVQVIVRDYVELKGITGVEGDKVALLNTYPFKEGDANVDLRVQGRDGRLLTVLQVTILRISENEVVFTVNGEAREYTKKLQD